MTFRWRKWDGAPHWEHECVYLGSDRWGDWVGQPRGWRSARPGREVIAERANVTLVPPGGDYAATVNQRRSGRVRVYIDLGWDVRWSASDPLLVEGIDMDLDVVRALDPRGTWVDDRDEWAEHSVLYGYPEAVMARLEVLALDLERRVRAVQAPFDDATADGWLDRLRALGPHRHRLDG